MSFEVKSNFKPAGDQPKAISELTELINKNNKNQTLKGVTGSGKTFTMANIISNLNKPSIIMAHNKTLAAQIYEEMLEFFPNNAVEYFVSYYDYYQPEAYIPRTDTYIEKDSSINEQIDLMRHSATRSLLERKDTIVVSSVSCIYGLGSPVHYTEMTLGAKKHDKISIAIFAKRLAELQYERNEIEFTRGKFRVKGDCLDIIPSYSSKTGLKIIFFGNEIEKIYEFDPITGIKNRELNAITIYANSHFITPKNIINNAIKDIKNDLEKRLDFFRKNNQLLEAQRLEQKTNFDIEMLQQTGSCKGIENYSRYLTGREPGSPPPTLFEYLPNNALLFADESHVTIPQIRGMYNGDQARKRNLVEHGFRLPSALDNRPLKFEEWDSMRPPTIFVSATPGPYEYEVSKKTVEQIIRPTGLIDPTCTIKKASNQVEDAVSEIVENTKTGFRTLITTLTKKMSEDLCTYLKDMGIKVAYLHSDIKTLERSIIIEKLRNGIYDVLVGINLLREGLDIPECSLILILDADKEGFLRSETSLIQTIGRAARNANGRVVLYADKMTNSINKAIEETNRRREIQTEYNIKHNITPKTTFKKLKDIAIDENIDLKNIEKNIKKLTSEMFKQASELNFEKAAELRNEIDKLKQVMLKN